MPPTVLIASPEYLPALRERKELGEVVAFADTDALKALDLITRQRPKVVALERDFAATSRGTALINRIKADPSLTECEIRIISHDNGSGTTSPDSVVEAAAPAMVAAPSTSGTRRARSTCDGSGSGYGNPRPDNLAGRCAVLSRRLKPNHGSASPRRQPNVASDR